MALQATLRRRYLARIYTSELILEGQLEPIGPLLDDLNDPVKSGLLLHDAQIAPLVAGSGLRPFALQEATVDKSDFQLVYLSNADDYAALNLMKRAELMIVYTSRFVVRGRFHMGGETRLRDFVDGLSGTFLAASEATIYPLFQSAIAIPKSYPLLLINKRQIRLYHPATAVQPAE